MRKSDRQFPCLTFYLFNLLFLFPSWDLLDARFSNFETFVFYNFIRRAQSALFETFLIFTFISLLVDWAVYVWMELIRDGLHFFTSYLRFSGNEALFFRAH